MQLLPKWVLTNERPAFFDTESGSAIVQTARVYGAMQELIKEYNAFADATNKIITEFKAESAEEMECFKRCLTELIENYIKSIDIKIDKQDAIIAEEMQRMNAVITEAAQRMDEKLEETIAAAVEEREITIPIEYNEETEEITVTAAVSEAELDEIIEKQNTYIGGDAV